MQMFNLLIKTKNRTFAIQPCANKPLIKSSAQARASGATCPPLQSKFVNRRVLNDELVMKKTKSYYVVVILILMVQ